MVLFEIHVRGQQEALVRAALIKTERWQIDTGPRLPSPSPSGASALRSAWSKGW